MPSGRSWASRMFNAGKFRIDDSSVIVPLSRQGGPGVHLEIHVVGEPERLQQLALAGRACAPSASIRLRVRGCVETMTRRP